MKRKEDFFGFENHEYNPIIREKSKDLLVELLKKYNPKNILEIGTFIGYSASIMLEVCPYSFVTTIEKDKDNFEYALKNLSSLGFVGRFEARNCDALSFLEENQNEKFDFIFLDGPKGQYIKYLPYIKKMLASGGVFFADDVLYYGLVYSQEKVIHKHRSIVNNLRKFLDTLKNDPDFETEIYNFEDGVSVSIKK